MPQPIDSSNLFLQLPGTLEGNLAWETKIWCVVDGGPGQRRKEKFKKKLKKIFKFSTLSSFFIPTP